MEDTMYKINMNIPGWNKEDILLALAEISAKIKPTGCILELGALFGRTTYAVGHNKHPDTKYYVVDCWSDLLFSSYADKDYWFHDRNCGIEENKLVESHYKNDKLAGEDFFKLWQHFTVNIPNLLPTRNFTMMPTDNFPMMDLIIHDAGHDYKSVYEDLNHWLPKLKDDGIIVVDDYEPVHFPDLVEAVNQFVTEKNLKTTMVTHRNILLERKS